MSGLVVTFLIALLGMVWILGSQALEERYGKAVLLPEWLHVHDERIERSVYVFLERFGRWLRHHGMRVQGKVSKAYVKVVSRREGE